MASYLENLAGQNLAGHATPELQSQSGVVQAAQRELQKFKVLQERRAQIAAEMQSIELQLTKTQGALEVFQGMGVIKPQ
jgi:hypothetical protein